MTDPTRAGRAPRYRVIVHELRDGRQTTVMDATAAGFIAAAATIRNGKMDIALGDGGSPDLKAHIALFIAGQYDA
jgi:hypothetical protein